MLLYPKMKLELIGASIEFWIDYNYQRDDPWLNMDGEEGRRYQCGDCNSPFTLGVVLCGEEPVKYECNECYEKKKEGKFYSPCKKYFVTGTYFE